MSQKLATVEIQNFLSIAYLKLSFSGTEPFVLRGPNGSGKSAVLEAIWWALTGETHRGLGADEVQKRGTKDTFVRLHFTSNLSIVRYRKHKRYKDHLHLGLVDDEEAHTLGTNKLTQAQLYERLHTSNAVLRATVLFGQNADGLSKAKPTEIKDILETMLGVLVYKQAEANAKEQARTLSSEIRQVEVKREAALQGLATLEGILQDHQRENEALREQNTEARHKRSIERARLVKEAKNMQGTIANTRKLLDSASHKQQKASEAHKEASARYNDARHELQVVQSSLDSLTKEDICPTCKQKVDKEHIKQERRKLVRRIANLEEKERAHRQSYDETAEAMESARTVYAAHQRRLSDAEYALRQAEREIRELDRYEDQQHKELPTKKVEESITQHQDQVDALSKQLVRLNKKLGRTEFWVRGFGPKGLRDYVLWSALPTIETKANDILGSLSNEGLRVSIEQAQTKQGQDREGLIAIVVHKSHQTVSITECSGGERRKVDIALQLAVASSGPLGVVLFDEWFDSLDFDSADQAFTVLRAISKEKTVLVATHHDRFEASCIVSKANDTSTYLERS